MTLSQKIIHRAKRIKHYPSIPPLAFKGFDDFSRALFLHEKGVMLVDVDGQLHTMNGEGEPCTPVRPTPKPIVFDEIKRKA